MLLGGDEISRTQGGNNNAYCQDSEISWFDWEHVDETLLDFTRRLIRLRKKHPIFRRRRFFEGKAIHGVDVHDIRWFTPEGGEMSNEDWAVGYAKSLAVFLNGEGITDTDMRGERIVDDSFYILFNAHHEPLDFTLPIANWSRRWIKVFATSDLSFPKEEIRYLAGKPVPMEARSLMVLRRMELETS